MFCYVLGGLGLLLGSLRALLEPLVSVLAGLGVNALKAKYYDEQTLKNRSMYESKRSKQIYVREQTLKTKSKSCMRTNAPTIQCAYPLSWARTSRPMVRHPCACTYGHRLVGIYPDMSNDKPRRMQQTLRPRCVEPVKQTCPCLPATFLQRNHT